MNTLEKYRREHKAVMVQEERWCEVRMKEFGIGREIEII